MNKKTKHFLKYNQVMPSQPRQSSNMEKMKGLEETLRIRIAGLFVDEVDALKNHKIRFLYKASIKKLNVEYQLFSCFYS